MEIIFLRKSRSDNPKETMEETLERHEKQLQDYAYREFGYYIPEHNIYREVISGGERLEDRPVFQEVLKRIEDKEVTRLLCVDTARISRSGIYGAGEIINYIRFSKTLICTLGRTYNLEDEFDRKFLEMEMLNSSSYLDYTKQILGRGRKHSVAIGNFVGSTAPFGYKKIKLKDEKGFILGFNNETEYVRLMFDMYLAGEGTTNIANHLNTLDIKPSRNDKWTPEIVNNVLHNVTYAGFLTWERRKQVTIVEDGSFRKVRQFNKEHTLVKGRHEPIVTIEEFDKVQRMFATKNVVKVRKDFKLQNPLATILVCSQCKKTMMRHKATISKGVYGYYLVCPTSKCKTSSSLLEDIEDAIISKLQAVLSEFEYYLDNYEEEQIKFIEGNKNALNKIDNKINDLITQKNNALIDFNARDIDREEYLFLKKGIQDKIKILELKKDQYSNTEAEDKIIKIKKAIPIISLCIKDYYLLNTEDKNELLKAIIDKVYYSKFGRSSKTTKSEFNLEMHLNF